MGRIQGREAMKNAIKKYGGSGVDYFSLKDDGDSALVRILHQDDQDLDLVLVHKTEIEGKERFVECLAEETGGQCPLCSISPPVLKLFIFVYNYEADKIQVWERGQTMIDFLLGFIDKYGHLSNRDYEIQRHGKKGSKKTQYQLFPMDKGDMREGGKAEGKTLELPKKPELFGTFVLQKTVEELTEYIQREDPQPRDRKPASERKNGPGF